MRGQRILHPELAKAVASMGHQDILLVTDAGFPIPRDAWRIDLGFYAGLPDVLDILRALRQEIFVEEAHMAAEVETHNPRLYAALQDIYTGSGADFVATTHERLIAKTAPRAKAIVRSGSLNPWANVALVCGTDPFAWFTEDSGTTILPAYVERRRRIEEGVIPTM